MPDYVFQMSKGNDHDTIETFLISQVKQRWHHGKKALERKEQCDVTTKQESHDTQSGITQDHFESSFSHGSNQSGCPESQLLTCKHAWPCHHQRQQSWTSCEVPETMSQFPCDATPQTSPQDAQARKLKVLLTSTQGFQQIFCMDEAHKIKHLGLDHLHCSN